MTEPGNGYFYRNHYFHIMGAFSFFLLDLSS